MLEFAFKFYYDDVSSKVAGGKSSKPENLKFGFDGTISWEEYDRIADNPNIAVQEVANMAKEFFNKTENNKIIKVEIINIETNEVIVSSKN